MELNATRMKWYGYETCLVSTAARILSQVSANVCMETHFVGMLVEVSFN